MAKKKSPYVLQPATGTTCAAGHRVELLVHEDALITKRNSPAFYVCWSCQTIGQIGQGPVRRTNA